MKNLSLLILLLLILSASFTAYAQYSVPVSLVEGASNKANAFCGRFLFWEQSTDTLSTAIYYRQQWLGNDENLLLSESGVHYKNPKIFSAYMGADTSALFTFEKGMDGKTELWFAKVANDDGFSQPFAFADDGQTNNQFAFVSMNNYFAWNANDHLLISRVFNDGSFDETDTVFSGPVRDIIFKDQNVFWISSDADSSYLMKSERDWPGGWLEPEVLFSAKEIGSLAGNNEGRIDGVVGLSFTNDTVWHITNIYPDYNSGGYNFYPLDISADSALDFEIFSTDIGVKWELEQYYFALVKDTTGANEIFVNDWWNSYDDLYQLSFLNTATRNPRFFLGENTGQWGNNLYLVFEAKVDGYWQLYYSYQFISWGSIGENGILEGVEISPNPATNLVKISNERGMELSYVLYDIAGRILLRGVSSESTISLDTGKLKRGACVLMLSNGSDRSTQKIILE